jgi:hypothetical protein
MAELPGVALQPVEGQQLPVDAVQPTDFGLQHAAEGVERAATIGFRARLIQMRAQAQADKAAVAPALVALKSQNDQDLEIAALPGAGNAAPAGAPSAPASGGAGAATAAPAAPAVASSSAAPAPGVPAPATGSSAPQTELQPAPANFGDPASLGFVTAAHGRSVSNAAAIEAQHPEWTPGMRAQFSNMASEEHLRVASAAGELHTNAIVAPLKELAEAQQTSRLGAAMTGFNDPMAQGFQALQLGHADGDTDLPAKTDALFDATAASALAAAPADLRPQLTNELASQKILYHNKAVDFQLTHATTGILKDAGDQMATLSNTVLSAPDNYQTASSVLLPKIIASLPAGLQDEARAQGAQQLAEARIEGLVTAGHGDVALAELNRGDYDKIFTDPKTKEEMIDKASGDDGKRSVAQDLAAINYGRQADANAQAIASTGKGTGFDPAAGAGVVSNEIQARAIDDARQARKVFVAQGAPSAQSNATLAARAAAPAPQPGPTYADDYQAWKISTEAARTELAARQQAGTWAYTKSPVGPQLQTALDKWTQTQGDPTAAGTLVGLALGVQASAGIGPSAREILPQTVAAALAHGVTNASADQRMGAMANLAHLVQSLPTVDKLPDGTTANPRAMFISQLEKAGMTPVEVSAIADFSGPESAAQLGRVAAALSDPEAAKGLSPQQAKSLGPAVRSALQPWLDTIAPLPGATALSQARIDRTMLVARELIVTQHMQPAAAIAEAVKDATGDFRYVDGWRMPSSLAGGVALNSPLSPAGMVNDGAGMARQGARNMMTALLGDSATNLYVPAGQQRQAYAAGVLHAGRWVTAPDDSGLILMTPHGDGTWDTVADKFGRPVRATWGELENYANGAGAPFAAPPPNALHTSSGAPVGAVSASHAFGVVMDGIGYHESHGRAGVQGPMTSTGTAKGVYQTMNSMVDTYAPRLGLPVDYNRANNDPDYDRKIASAAVGDYLQRYGTSPGGIVLTLAAYAGGSGRIEGYTDKKTGAWRPGWLQTIGDPRSGRVSINDWVAQLPAEERETVRSELDHIATRLEREQRAGG